MNLRDDVRGQALQVGAVLLFAALITAFSTYQAFIVPDQNRKVEFNHGKEVRNELIDLRDAVVSVPRDNPATVSVTLGTQYPSQAVFVNPPPPTGSLRTAGTTNASRNLTIRNATGTGEAGDFWDGSTRRYPTGRLVYDANYNEYNGVPTYYDNTVIFSRTRTADVLWSSQRVVDDEDIRLVTLNGSYSKTQSQAVSVDVRPVSVSTRTAEVRSDSTNVTISFPTRLSADRWRTLLDGEFVTQGGHVEGVRAESLGPKTDLLAIDLEPGVGYDLRMSKVGLGTGVRAAEPGYVTAVEGNESTVPEGGSGRVVVEVRDRYNNPIEGTNVNASATLSDGSVTPTQGETDDDGQVVLEYDAPQDISGVAQTTERINVSYTVGSSKLNDTAFRSDRAANMTALVTIRNADDSGLGVGGGGNGAYAVDWEDPTRTGVSCTNGAEGTCTLDANETSAVGLTAATSPTADGVTVEYAVSNKTVGTVSPESGTTDSAGTDSTTFRPASNGSLNVYATSGSGGDTLDVDVINVFKNLLGETGVVTHEQTTAGDWRTVSFARSYTDPVVVARPLSFQDKAPATVRVRSVTSNSFEFRVDEPGEGTANGFDTSDDIHGQEQFAYWVMESGTHEIDGGVTVDAGTQSSVPAVDDTPGTVSVSYNQSFSGVPVAFSQTQSFNDPTPVVTRQHTVGSSNFDVGIQQAENDQSGHASETVGYIAIQEDQAENDGVKFEAGATTDSVEGVETYGSAANPVAGYEITFGQSYGSAPVFIAQQQTLDGPNTGWVRYSGLSATKVDVAIDEDLQGDSERSHTQEVVGYFAIGSGGPVYANQSTTGGGGGGGGGGNSAPSVTVDSTTVTSIGGGGNGKNDVQVQFTGSDTDGNLDSYTVVLYDGNGKSTQLDSASSSSYTGGTTSETVSDTSGGPTGSSPYYVVVTVKDTNGASTSAEQST